MARIARLHNGTEVHFPDHFSDEEMDDAVARMHTAPQPVDSDLLAGVMTAFGQHAGSLSAERAKQQRQQDAGNLLRHAQILTATQGHGDAIRAAGTTHAQAVGSLQNALEGGMAALIPAIGELADNSAHVTDLISAVHALSATVRDVGQEIVRVMMLPKEIQPDEKGKPRSIRVSTKKG